MKTFDFEKVPIVEIVNEILLDGVKKGASDIHFDPSKDKITIRMRVDGVLYDYSVVPVDYKRNTISRVKMIASMNIMETRLPQDGAIKSKIGEKMLDLRVSSLPTNCGEKVVLRILDYSKSLQGLETLGFSEANLNKIIRMIEVPNGIVLVTGATGSGKSTTVYSILQRLNTREVNIITVEDPVEMDVEGINQVQAQSEIGLDFASVLRSILRQDPDIIMIGEIRDSETAKIAVRASITGHKVLSTIHTNSALNTIERLTDMEVERYLIGTSLNGVISQKLARKLCPKCRVARPVSDYEKELFKKVLKQDIETVYDINPDGCDECVKGYRNRIAIAEVLFITDEVKTGITNGYDKEKMRDLVYGQSDTHTLLQDGLEKVALGETSFDEILKLVDLENDLAIHEELDKKGLSTGSNLEAEKAAIERKKAELEAKAAEEAAKKAQAPAQQPAAAPAVQPATQPTTQVATTQPAAAPAAQPAVAQQPAQAPAAQPAPVTTATTPVATTEATTTPAQPAQPAVEQKPAKKEAEVIINGTPVGGNTPAEEPAASSGQMAEVIFEEPVEATADNQSKSNVNDAFEEVLNSMQPSQAEATEGVDDLIPPVQETPAIAADGTQMVSSTQTPAPKKDKDKGEKAEVKKEEKPTSDEPKVELTAVIPPNNTQAAVNLNTGEVPKNMAMFEQ